MKTHGIEHRLSIGIIRAAHGGKCSDKELIWSAFQLLTEQDSDYLPEACRLLASWILGSDEVTSDDGWETATADGARVDLCAESMDALMRVTEVK